MKNSLHVSCEQKNVEKKGPNEGKHREENTFGWIKNKTQSKMKMSKNNDNKEKEEKEHNVERERKKCLATKTIAVVLYTMQTENS